MKTIRNFLIVLFVLLSSVAYSEIGIEQIVDPATATWTTKGFDVLSGMTPLVVYVDGTLDPGEAVTIQQANSDGTWQDIYEGGVVKTMSSDQTYFAVYSPARLRFTKGTTTNAVGLYWYNK